MDELTEQLRDIRWRASELLDGLTSEQLLRRPDPAKWSIAECLAHLNQTAAVLQPLMDSAIKSGRKQNCIGEGPFKPGVLGRFLRWLAEPPPKIRLRAPKNILPPTSITDPAAVVAEFTRCQDEWERLGRESSGLDQQKLKIPSPFTGLSGLRLCAILPWMMAHERRHLLQAEKVKQQIQAKAARA